MTRDAIAHAVRYLLPKGWRLIGIDGVYIWYDGWGPSMSAYITQGSVHVKERRRVVIPEHDGQDKVTFVRQLQKAIEEATQ